MNAFTIKDLENLSGIKAHTIRIWEQRYHFLKPKRTTTNIRYYSNDELKTILNIALLNKYGFKISHIDRMQPDEIREKILSLGDVKARQERVLNELVQEMAELEIEKFERVIANYITAEGMERTIIQIIFPFLERIGILWQTGHINPAQEHLVTNIIRNQLIVAIESAAPAIKTDTCFLLYLPEGEHHELGLLFMNYLLKSRGAQTIYLGANVPLKDAEYVVELKKPGMAFIHLTAAGVNFNFEKFLTDIQHSFGDIRTIISGHITQDYRKPVPSCVQLMKSLPEVMELLSTI